MQLRPRLGKERYAPLLYLLTQVQGEEEVLFTLSDPIARPPNAC